MTREQTRKPSMEAAVQQVAQMNRAEIRAAKYGEREPMLPLRPRPQSVDTRPQRSRTRPVNGAGL